MVRVIDWVMYRVTVMVMVMLRVGIRVFPWFCRS